MSQDKCHLSSLWVMNRFCSATGTQQSVSPWTDVYRYSILSEISINSYQTTRRNIAENSYVYVYLSHSLSRVFIKKKKELHQDERDVSPLQ